MRPWRPPSRQGIRCVRWHNRHEDPRDWTCGFISRADVAEFLVKQVNDARLIHKTPALIG